MSDRTKLPAMLLGAWCAVGPGAADASAPGLDAGSGPIRFRPLDVYVDSGNVPLAAYQVEVVVAAGDAQIVGVEGGSHAAFNNPPYYDAGALMGGRIVLAAFNTSDDLPKGSQRVCTLHVREAGPNRPDYVVELIVAADSEGRPVRARVTMEPRKLP